MVLVVAPVALAALGMMLPPGRPEVRQLARFAAIGTVVYGLALVYDRFAIVAEALVDGAVGIEAQNACVVVGQPEKGDCANRSDDDDFLQPVRSSR